MKGKRYTAIIFRALQNGSTLPVGMVLNQKIRIGKGRNREEVPKVSSILY
jgi:hypothetical protein